MKEVNHSSVTILAIDDEADVLALIAEVLEQAGHCCLCAQNAEGAREAMRHATPDVIISDVNLVGHSGSTICEQLKQQAGIRDVPVMFLSAAQVPDIIRRSSDAGGSYYLRKPFDASVLLQIIEKVRLTSSPRSAAPAPTAQQRAVPPSDAPKLAGPRIIANRAGTLVTK
jgi:DNA-binding response OmpR family regulator